ncbi:hypothetical protein [Herbaspirillum lusitanum]|uniref:hypothetical protein n=1 Tax=Herbaspirillum lusitanum TaxID=213312 RepID=UPI002238596E|nr:hypothetical protein [Herbaspirillum lusitanum]
MQKFATTILISLISSVSTTAICHIGQRLITKRTIVPPKTAFYVVRAPRTVPATHSDHHA